MANKIIEESVHRGAHFSIHMLQHISVNYGFQKNMKICILQC